MKLKSVESSAKLIVHSTSWRNVCKSAPKSTSR
jgi:hypothetical protein